jgi:hypothetical protein
MHDILVAQDVANLGKTMSLAIETFLIGIALLLILCDRHNIISDLIPGRILSIESQENSQNEKGTRMSRVLYFEP